mgnify:CR=1 FL=1
MALAEADSADMITSRSGGVYAVLLPLFLIGLAASLLTGPAAIPPATSLAGLVGLTEGPVAVVMQEIRLPRAVLGAAVGAALGLSGAAMQGLLRNPLAEPGLIGVSATAALGAVIALQLGWAAFALALPLAALVGAGIAVLLLLLLAGPRGSSLVLILAGIAISALAAALTALVLNLSLIHISEPTRPRLVSRMPSSA